jgi:hypothetical protein
VPVKEYAASPVDRDPGIEPTVEHIQPEEPNPEKPADHPVNAAAKIKQ